MQSWILLRVVVHPAPHLLHEAGCITALELKVMDLNSHLDVPRHIAAPLVFGIGGHLDTYLGVANSCPTVPLSHLGGTSVCRGKAGHIKFR